MNDNDVVRNDDTNIFRTGCRFIFLLCFSEYKEHQQSVHIQAI
jgi:hypothetical protein